MAETSKNKIYYNDNENSVADVLADMKKMAESTDEAIEKSKYNDAAIKKSISDVEKKQVEKNTEQDSKIVELQTEKSKLETELKEMQEDFYQNSIRGQASGEYIHVEDSSNCRSIIGISGNSEQETREGYNLLNLTSLIGKTETKNGITYKINEDCSITVNGTPTDYTSFNLLNMSLKAGTYKFTDGLNSNNVFLQTLGDFQHISQNNTFSLAEDGKATVYLVILAGTPTLNNTTLYPMIYEGTEDKPYEQYGAMPSQNCPSSIKAVGSNVNLIDLSSNTNITKNGITFTKKEDGTVIANGTAIDTANYALQSDFTDYGHGIFNLSGCPSGGGSNTYAIITYKNDWSTMSPDYGFGAKLKIDKNTTIRSLIIIQKGQTVTNLVFKPKLVEGTEVGEYSKYGQGCVKITKCNKNLFDKDNAIKEYELDGTTGKIMSNSLYFTSDYIRVNPNEQYYLSGKNTGNSNCFYNKDKKFISRINLENGLLTVPDDLNIYYLRINSRLTAIDTTMLEKNTKKSAYEEHQEQTYIMPTQKEMLQGDYFDFDNEEEVHVWGNVIVNGTETINKNSNSEFFSITKSMSQFDTSANAIKQSISNYGAGTTLGLGSGNTNNKYSFNASTIYLDCYNSNINTVEKLKVQLTKNNMKIYAKLATPQRIAFTEEQKAVAKELNNARTYKNVTNIYSTDEISPILSLDYAKDLETLLNNTQALAVNNASEGV